MLLVYIIMIYTQMVYTVSDNYYSYAAERIGKNKGGPPPDVSGGGPPCIWWARLYATRLRLSNDRRRIAVHIPYAVIYPQENRQGAKRRA